MLRRALSGGGHHGGGHHGGHHGGGFRRGGGGGFFRGGFGPGIVYDYPWGYDYDSGPLVIVEEDDEDKQRRIARLAAEAALRAANAAKQPVKGLGIFRPHDRVAHPITHSVRGLGALGAATGPVPSSCWDAPGFKDCQGRVFAAAQKSCFGQAYPNAAWPSYDDCVKDYTATFTGPSAESVTCVSQFCPKAMTTTTATSGKYPWGVYSPDTLALQKTTNAALAEAGYCPIGEDGKLGGGTCGARKTLKESGAVPGMTWPSTCQKFTTPSKPPCKAASASWGTAAPAVVPSSTVAPAPVMQASMTGGFNWKTALLVGAGVLAVGGLAYYATRKQE